MLVSSFTLQNGTLITPLLYFFSELGLVCTKKHRFVEYTPRKCFNSFVQSAIDAGRKLDENPNSSVTAETKNLLAISCFDYQIMNCSQHTVTTYLNDKNTHAAVISKLFEKLNLGNNALSEIELAKAEIEHKERKIVGFFTLEYSKRRMLQLYYNLQTKFSDMKKFEEFEMGTDSRFRDLTENELEDCIRPEMKAEWEHLRLTDLTESHKADAVANFFPRRRCDKHKKH